MILPRRQIGTVTTTIVRDVITAPHISRIMRIFSELKIW